MANSAITRQVTLPEASVTESQLAAGATLKLGTEQASTSGTAITFTGIPAGTKQIMVSLIGVSTNGTSNLLIQLGDAGGIETTDYTSVSGGADGVGHSAPLLSSAGFVVTLDHTATFFQRGLVILVLEDSSDFTWAGHGIVSRATTVVMSTGSKALSAELTQIRITSISADTFDAGSINIAYK